VIVAEDICLVLDLCADDAGVSAAEGDKAFDVGPTDRLVMRVSRGYSLIRRP